MSSISTSSLPPMLPGEMASVLGDSAAVSALEGGAASPQPAGAFLDLSQAASEMTAGERVAMVGLEDDAALFGGSVGEAAATSIPMPAAVESLYDPTQDVANPAYADPTGASGVDWSHDAANPGYWA